MNQAVVNEIQRRRTFAIISHPDAGKTTLTEKLLLYGGALRLAGTVKSRKSKQHAVSDWMEMEKQRGISVTSSVLQFEYQGSKLNILDTPGHQDFSEDTYRTLMAADSAVMLIDAAKGVESQTKKLFHVCRQRGIPIFTFINKMDRDGQEPLDLLHEVEKVLNIKSYPMNWPIGRGREFMGIYDRATSRIELFGRSGHGSTIAPSRKGGPNDPAIVGSMSPPVYELLKEDVELLDLAGDEFDAAMVARGELTPVFFGSALTNFGVEAFLKSFIDLSLPPHEKNSSVGVIHPDQPEFSGFIFKIQANMDPAYRNRIAFLRICSGVFNRGMVVKHVPTGKSIRLAQSKQFMAQEATIIEEAYPGDIVGLVDAGLFGIGDTLTETSDFAYEAIPKFPPEFFAQVHLRDAMKRKQFVKGIEQLTNEGAVQRFRRPDIGLESPIVAAVGVLQFEVLEYRLTHEYGVDIRLEHLPYTLARWAVGKNLTARSLQRMDNLVLQDEDDNFVVLFNNQWAFDGEAERNDQVIYLAHSPVKGASYAAKGASRL
ncbi:MAG: peptide chain release factor 3 [Candidatus Desulforudaceae bacterium]|nr:peptide chain release factor 3 [Bacillota bacterium]MBV1728151.1 peptide chain release factor 3 [Desulforudis sp.]MDP3051842.1 peptide chain release factor 3 [Eubacteriales bacterium]MDQ7790268.1 peptide chain release factor 3 [Clostridia bacterium]MBU4553954.1 peptide chain release factor 3 [Bacillota bacterium]